MNLMSSIDKLITSLNPHHTKSSSTKRNDILNHKDLTLAQLTQQYQSLTSIITSTNTSSTLKSKSLRERAQISLQLNKTDLALNDCVQSLKIDQSNILSYIVLGQTYERLQKWDDALSTYDLALLQLSHMSSSETPHIQDPASVDINDSSTNIQPTKQPSYINSISQQHSLSYEEDDKMSMLSPNQLEVVSILPPTHSHSHSIQSIIPPSIQLETTNNIELSSSSSSYSSIISTIKSNLKQFLSQHYISTSLHHVPIPTHLQYEYNKYESMTNWLQQNGATFPKLLIKHYSDTHRGVHSLGPILENETICHIPLNLIITSQVARSSVIGTLLQSFQLELRSRHTYLALYLLHEQLKSKLFHDSQRHQQQHENSQQQQLTAMTIETPPQQLQYSKQHNTNLFSLPIPTEPSFFEPYINILPTEFDTIPLFFSHDDLLLLSGSFTLSKIHDRCKSLHDEYLHLKSSLIENLYELFCEVIVFPNSSPEQDSTFSTPLSSSPTTSQSHILTPNTNTIRSLLQQVVSESPPQPEDDISTIETPHIVVQSYTSPLPMSITTSQASLSPTTTTSNHLSSTTISHVSPNSPALSSLQNFRTVIKKYTEFNLDANPFFTQLCSILGLNFNSSPSSSSSSSTTSDESIQPISLSIQSHQHLYTIITTFVDSVVIPFTFEQFVWARMCVITRIFGMTVDQLKTDGLVPFCDMLNHKLPRQTRWEYNNNVSGFIIASLHARNQRGIEIFDSYGRKCNNRFFINYGFTLTENFDNEALIHVGCDLYNIDQCVIVTYPKDSNEVNDDETHNLQTSDSNTQPQMWSSKKKLPTYYIQSPIPSVSVPFSTLPHSYQHIQTYIDYISSLDTFHTISQKQSQQSQSQQSQQSQSQCLSSPQQQSQQSPPQNLHEVTFWPHEIGYRIFRDRFLMQKLSILGIDTSNFQLLNDDSTFQQTPSHFRHVKKTQRSYQVPANIMDPKTVQLLSYLRFINLLPEQINDLRGYQTQNNTLYQSLSPSSTAVVYSATPITFPSKSVSPSQPQPQFSQPSVSSNSTPKSSLRISNSLNLDNIVLVSLENETKMLKLLLYTTHIALSKFPTTLEQDIQLLSIHHSNTNLWNQIVNANNDNDLKPHPKPTISNHDLITLFSTNSISPLPSSVNHNFILTTNQYNSLIQIRGEKIVLKILQEFALETLSLIHHHQQIIDKEVEERKLNRGIISSSSKHNINHHSINTTINNINTTTTTSRVRELLARRDVTPHSSVYINDHKHEDGYESNEKIIDDDDHVDNVNQNEDNGVNDDIYISNRQAEILTIVAQSYPTFSQSVQHRIEWWSNYGQHQQE